MPAHVPARRRRSVHLSPWWATLTLFWVCLQGAFGALTVTMKLFPAIVTLHLAGGLVLLALLGVQVVRGSAATQRLAMPRWLRRWLVLGFALLALQIFWAAGSAPTMRCWPALIFRSARAAGGPR